LLRRKLLLCFARVSLSPQVNSLSFMSSKLIKSAAVDMPKAISEGMYYSYCASKKSPIVVDMVIR
jgi:hypothetical protein